VGDTGPLTVALTVAVCEAAEELAKASPGGRLPVPGVVLLDEAANVVRWNTLPDLFSHYGSRGVLLSVFLQSWSQGVDVWGASGMRKMWSAANVKVLGSGVSEVEFLSDVSQLVGHYRPLDVSRSTGSSGASSSRSLATERVLEVADLAELPRGRVVVLAAGAPATLARTVPWWEGPRAAAVRASVAAHDPSTGQTCPVEPDVPAPGAGWSS
jgi:type IV secretory pathway TraG/TraD family ATPase VirD4